MYDQGQDTGWYYLPVVPTGIMPPGRSGFLKANPDEREWVNYV
jgi:hypothetical protein